MVIARFRRVSQPPPGGHSRAYACCRRTPRGGLTAVARVPLLRGERAQEDAVPERTVRGALQGVVKVMGGLLFEGFLDRHEGEGCLSEGGLIPLDDTPESNLMISAAGFALSLPEQAGWDECGDTDYRCRRGLGAGRPLSQAYFGPHGHAALRQLRERVRGN